MPVRPMKRYLAFDLGTKTGWAVGNKFWLSSSGVINLNERGRFSPRGFSLFQAHVGALIAKYQADDLVIGVEKPHNGPYFHATHILFGLLGVLEATCQTAGRKLDLYSPATIKKYWTGNGRAGKPEMMKETRRLGFEPEDHNESDAIALLYLISGVKRE